MLHKNITALRYFNFKPFNVENYNLLFTITEARLELFYNKYIKGNIIDETLNIINGDFF